MIKAIETEYNGYRFRSRLEARWAVFFTKMGFKWEYEPEGFILGDGVWYLPDFMVKTPQGADIWYEVKPEGVTSDTKFTKFCDSLRALFEEEIKADSPPGYNAETDYRQFAISTRYSILSGDPMNHMLSQCGQAKPRICPRCGFIGLPESEASHDHWTKIKPGETYYYGCAPCDYETPGGGGHNYRFDGILATTYRPHKGLIEVRSAISCVRINEAVEQSALLARSSRFDRCGSAKPGSVKSLTTSHLSSMPVAVQGAAQELLAARTSGLIPHGTPLAVFVTNPSHPDGYDTYEIA